jgi:two-component system, sensor histidine kinase and response regulator
MKELLFLLFIIPLSVVHEESPYRQRQEDSLVTILQSKNDSARIPVLISLSWDLRNASPEKSIKYGMEAINLANRYKDYKSLAKAYSFVGVAYRVRGNYSESIDFYYKGLDIANKYEIPEQAAYAHLNLANLYIYQEHAALAFENIKEAEAIAGKIDNKSMLAYVYLYYGRAYSLENNLDTALISYQKSLLLRQTLNQIPEQATCFKYIGDIYFQKDSFATAMYNYNMSLKKVDKQNDKDLYANILNKEALILAKEDKLNEAAGLALESLKTASQIRANMAVRDALQVLVTISIKTQDYKSASDYQQKVIQYNDTLFNQKLTEKIFSLQYLLDKQQRNARIDLLNKDNAIKELKIKRIKIISLGLTTFLTLLASVFIILLVLLKQRRDHSRLLESQNQEIIEHRNNIEQQNLKLIEANEQLENSEEDLKKTVQTRDKLLSIIAHDLRNPFTALVGLTEILRNDAKKLSTEEIAEFASMINTSSYKLLNLIENLLQWAKSQTGTLKLIPTAFSLKSLTDDVLKIYMTQAETKGINLKNTIPGNISVFIDHETFATIIRNLVSNGIKYTERGGNVTLTALQDNEKTVIMVSDTGVGMSPEVLTKLFGLEESFTTGGTSNEAGTGLGLVICKEFAERNGGTIGVESIPGKGTTFSVTLPIGKADQA